MIHVQPARLPADALLNRYAQREGCYTDCYSVETSQDVALSTFVEAFYTTWLFRLERFVLRWAVSRPSSDAGARDLANGTVEDFAAWSVEERTGQQLLMRDMGGRTRSWFMVAPMPHNGHPATRLFFGSAVVPVRNRKSGTLKLGLVFSTLLGFHRLYSRALLGAAKRRLDRH